jgi:hypothetical protein
MAPGVSQHLDSCWAFQLIRKYSIEIETEIGAKIALAMWIMMFLKVSLFGIGAATMLL